MRRVLKMFAPFLIVLGALHSTCCSSTPGPEPLAPESPYVWSQKSSVAVEVWLGPSRVQSGSGVILQSSQPTGTVILTNAHVVALTTEHTEEGLELVNNPFRKIRVHFEDGHEEWSDLITIKYSVDPSNLGKHVDLALLWIPYGGRTWESIPGFSPDGLQLDEEVVYCPWKPNNAPTSTTGVGSYHIYDPDWKDKDYDGPSRELPVLVIRMNRSVVKGNSGSPIYELDTGLLVGIVWGKSTDEADTRSFGLFVPVQEIKLFLEENDLTSLVSK